MATGPDQSATRDGGSELRLWLPSFLALAVIWGNSFLFIKVGIRELHPLWLTFARVAVGALTLLVMLVVTRDRLPRGLRLWGHLTVSAILGIAVPYTLFGYGEQRVSSVLAGIWNAATPLVALPLAVLVFRTERMTVRRAAGIGVGFVGVLIVLGVWRDLGGSHLTGQLMCFGAAMCYAVAMPYMKRFIAGREVSGLSISTAQLLIATAMLGVVSPLLAGAPPQPAQLSGRVLASVLALGMLGTGLAYVLNFRVIRVAGASTSASVTYLMPIVATLAGVLVLSEDLLWNQPVGALVVLVGVAVSQGVLHRLLDRWRIPPGAADPDTTDPGATEPDPADPEPASAVTGPMTPAQAPPPRAATGR
jgi:drug/metabolite transporter (DMT)-like permease